MKRAAMQWPPTGHSTVANADYRYGMQTDRNFDRETVAILRRALDEVFVDRRFFDRAALSPLEVAEHLLAQAAAGERDLDRLKRSAVISCDTQPIASVSNAGMASILLAALNVQFRKRIHTSDERALRAFA